MAKISASNKEAARFHEYKGEAERRAGERMTDSAFLGVLLDYYKEWPN